jgi:hypothetical protein
MGQWSSGYDGAMIAELFDEKIDEVLSDIFPWTPSLFSFSIICLLFDFLIEMI